MNKAKRLAILTRLRENDPHPTTELHFSSPFELLIAVLLSGPKVYFPSHCPAGRGVSS